LEAGIGKHTATEDFLEQRTGGSQFVEWRLATKTPTTAPSVLRLRFFNKRSGHRYEEVSCRLMQAIKRERIPVIALSAKRPQWRKQPAKLQAFVFDFAKKDSAEAKAQGLIE
jgi:hypothetical protein